MLASAKSGKIANEIRQLNFSIFILNVQVQFSSGFEKVRTGTLRAVWTSALTESVTALLVESREKQ